MRLLVKDFKKEVIIGVGRRIASYGKPVIVAHDARKSSFRIYKAVIAGILEAGGEAYEAGLYPTPGAMYAARKRGMNALVVTASHNPPEYNGFKALVDGLPVPREEIATSDNIAPRDRVGSAKSTELDEYERMLASEADKLERERNILVDFGHGAASVASKALSHRIRFVSLFGTPDGGFPIRNPEPREDTVEIMLKAFSGFDAGFAFDGDGDRVVVVDDRGRYVDDHVMLAIYAAYMADKGPIVTHVGASVIVNKLVEERGGRVIRVRVGDPFIARAALEHGAAFAGEPNGARIHPDAHYFPDGLLSLVRILRMLEELGRLSVLVDEVPKTVVIRESVERRRSYEEAMECIRSRLPEGYLEYNTIDGLRVRLDELERFLVRPSNTEPLIRVRVEARDKERAKKILETARSIAEACV